MYYDGTWWPGSVEAWRHKDGRWQVYVRLTVGLTQSGWVDAGDVRPSGVEVRVSGPPGARQVAMGTPKAPEPAAGPPAYANRAEQRRRRGGVQALWGAAAVIGVLALVTGDGVREAANRSESPVAHTSAARASGAQVRPASDHAHADPAATSNDSAPTVRPARSADSADLDRAVATCGRRWQQQDRPRDAARTSLSQWRLHIVAMNQLMDGEITLAQASAFWDRTRRGAIRKVERFQHEYARYRRVAAPCVAPGRSEAAEGLERCVRSLAAGDRELAVAAGAITAWHHHVQDMEMLRSGRITPAQATRRWLAAWRAGNRQLNAYEHAARAAAGQPRCG